MEKNGTVFLSKRMLLKAAVNVVPKVWGVEYWLVNRPDYCCKMLELQQGHSSSLHYHRKKHETFIVISGTCSLLLEGVTHVLHEGDSIPVRRGVAHRFFSPRSRDARRTAACLILEVSTHHDDQDVVRIEPSRVL